MSEYQSMPPLFVFLRHGEALHNISNRIHGPIAYTYKENEDAPLSEEGHHQTKNVAYELLEIFKDRTIDIFSSPLTRCIQTAMNASEHCKIYDKILDDLLIERLGGGHVCNNRKSFHELSEIYPDWSMQCIEDPPPMPLEREPIEEVQERMRQFWNWLREAYKTTDRGVLIVSHQEALMSLFGRDFKNAEYQIVY